MPFFETRVIRSLPFLIVLFLVGFRDQEINAIDLAVVNANVITMDEQTPTAEAVAMEGDKIVAVGTSSLIKSLVKDSTRVVDAQGRTLVPGFNDAHLHPGPIYPVMSRLGSVPCGPDDVNSIQELIRALREKARVTPQGDWIIGARYQDTKLGRHPTRADLDEASTVHPIYIGHSSGHVAAVNSLALRLAKVTRATPDPRGGAFDRTSDGVPTGVLREAAKKIVRDAGPEQPVATTQEKLAGFRRCFQQYVADGITSVQIAGTDPETVGLLKLLDQPVRLYAMLTNDYLDDLKRIREREGLGNNRLRLGGIKRWFGNSLSGRTCWLYEPYADRPGYYGIPPKDSQDDIDQRVLEIHQAGFQACIHANGDREIDMLLDAYEKALKAEPRENHRHRIEHGSVVNERILRRIKQLGLVLATHSYIYEHGDKMEAYGEGRWNMMHPNRSAIDLGIPVAGNSDSPVSKAHPMLRIQSMVTRSSAEGKVYGEKQRVTVEQAIRIWTLGSAYASFEEEIKGSITEGKLADVVLLETDPRAVPENQLGKIKVDITVIGGKIVFERTQEELIR